MEQRISGDTGFISLAQFGVTFSINFVLVFLPFYIGVISPYDATTTLIWTGLILGSPGIFLVVASPLWGGLTHRIKPKTLFMSGMLLHATAFVLMAFTKNLQMLCFLRILQGLCGGVSTIGFIIVSSSSPVERRVKEMGSFQSSMILGQFLGPLAGSLAASLLGYRGAFFSASALLFVVSIFCYFFVTEMPRLPQIKNNLQGLLSGKCVLMGLALCFISQVQIMFLPGILPEVLGSYGVHGTPGLRWAGVLIMLYTASALLGTRVWCALSGRIGAHRMILWLLAGSVPLQAMLALPVGIIWFSVIRIAQASLIAAIVPLTMATFTEEPRGSILGLMNSAKFAGNAFAPIMATSTLAYANLSVLCLALSTLSVLILAACSRRPPEGVKTLEDLTG
jgi:DHA1 family multidrug resistance protein-like MFS transporter